MPNLFDQYLPLVVFMAIAAVISGALLLAPFLPPSRLRIRKNSRPMNAASMRSTTRA